MPYLAALQQCLESEDYLKLPAIGPTDGAAPPEDESTSIELTGTDRPGLLSEVCAVLASLSCNIVKAEVWTHDSRAAAVIQITDEASGLAIHDAARLSKVQELLCNVMQGDGASSRGSTRTGVTLGTARAERRLHKLMLDDGGGGEEAVGGEDRRGMARPKAAAKVAVMDCAERRYTVVILRCRDRPKLLFDTLCALTDLQYVVFHGTVDAERRSREAYQVRPSHKNTHTIAGTSMNECSPESHRLPSSKKSLIVSPAWLQEYYVRHVDGHPARSDAERSRLVRCLEAAVERRASGVGASSPVATPPPIDAVLCSSSPCP